MKQLHQFRIFVAEDSFLYAHVLGEVLGELGNFKITSFTSAEECISMLGNNPDLVILDYNFVEGGNNAGGMNGMDALKQIKAQQPRTPVIVLSAQQDVQVVSDLLKAGAFDYIEKRDREKAMEKLQSAVQRALKI